jgi:lipopolysaccharide export system protein LptC
MILATGLSLWSILAWHPVKHQQGDNSKAADAFMEDVVAIIFNKAGLPSFKLVSPKMVHYPENNTTHVTTPHITLFRNSSKPWFIDSKRAKATHGTNEILFSEQVNIYHSADEANPTTTLKTESLTIFPNEDIATTHEPVTFIQPDTTVHAVGMLANLSAGTVKLLSQAQGEYAPAS